MENSSLFLILILLLVTSCADRSADALIIEPAGSAAYYINNQTLTDLKVVYINSEALNFQTDSTTVFRDSSTVIFTDGIIGVNPKPSDSFSSIRFFRTSDLSSPALVIEPVDDGDWNVIGQERDNSGYGLTEYEFTVDEQNLEQ
ncbi:hypothetical protein [Rhodohalobacter mucosus]|uniref:Uncharacterized protein n=1 Tax=Rhodohalobacter mucosus TaxID=2079485 RepID=A0A316U063_9BACT|nr:hypothetical protein [Rhodohalobacter mucosus]PWN06006.1 hypothetical protein DDZ15_12565 [Rhodohalobacter mucosus]